jgi:hypothetical protein
MHVLWPLVGLVTALAYVLSAIPKRRVPGVKRTRERETYDLDRYYSH